MPVEEEETPEEETPGYQPMHINQYLLYPSQMEISELPSSDFYYACRNNDIDLAKSLMETMTSDQIDKLEPNGSTALHSASYYGYCEIVELLLKKGTSRCIRDKYNCTPYEEGKTAEIKENLDQHQLLYILNLICCHPDFIIYEFQGQTYRGMKMDADDLKQYEIGAKIMTKSLLSISKDRSVAEKFAIKMEENVDAFQLINIQEINNNYGILIEIELRQCKPFVKTYKALAVGGSLLIAAAGIVTAMFLDDNQNHNCLEQ
ncbi:unnamed protein product [Didymodactylos carnosus]|uniref:Uncharacterized protein n=1 Tax=Didymodactylos carnosus TaxID=1234261 RepID=A0A814VC55_9BILA|nr:unnamed protein product [Didymodactylos carnosus]CAF1186137.1 unnamed protein product [Didymodactylos carnosus]CAF3578038.1 unnamed protein product [Didymodactylos carnosus]CAF3950405.1 unnamed protein product [Didymodactylos carnosus]